MNEEEDLLYRRMVTALDGVKVAWPGPHELADPMAFTDFMRGVFKQCREAIHHEIFSGTPAE